jgi:glycogen operon protein
VILDVVYNHTAEGDERGPTLSFRGLANEAYYILGDDRARYANYSGTGNTIKAHHTVARRLILDSLRYWVELMHVDGFRFDLASILARDEKGEPLGNPPLLWDIESDPVLAGTKMIAEAWDAGGLYQVGSFAGDSWKEWNGIFRDDVRRFLRGDAGLAPRIPARILGSPDVYGHEEREPEQSVNFVTCHDGFTLNDLVSYDRKHNEENREGGRDGRDENLSWNGGVEGPSDDPEVERLRERQIRNFLTLTLLSLGTPMIQMGDEVRRTQRGNNNAYCQDNPVSWFDWSLTRKNAGLLRFVKTLIRHRREGFLPTPPGRTLNDTLRETAWEWHGVRPGSPDWGFESRTVAFTGTPPDRAARFHAILNAYWEPLDFELPPGAWRRWIDTSLPSPQDILERSEAPLLGSGSTRVGPRTIVILVEGPTA